MESLGNVSPPSVVDLPRLLITVHGIRTFGAWQERLERKVFASVKQPTEYCHYRYGFFTVIAFLVPLFRMIAARRFRSELIQQLSRNKWGRVDIVAHSFGTYLVGWSLLKLGVFDHPPIHTVIFAGSVLRSTFPVRAIVGRTVYRFVNDCAIHDQVLLASQVFVLFTGMAGRVGFIGMESEHFRNRYFSFGHSGYFQTHEPEFMDRFWLPLLTSETGIQPHDERDPSVLWDLATLLLNNAEPIKLALYLSPLVYALLFLNGRLRYERAITQQLKYTQRQIELNLAETQREFALSLFRDGKQLSGINQVLKMSQDPSTVLTPDILRLSSFWVSRRTSLDSLLPSLPLEIVFRNQFHNYFRDLHGQKWDLGEDDIEFWSLSRDGKYLLTLANRSQFTIRSTHDMSVVMPLSQLGAGNSVNYFDWSDIAEDGPSGFRLSGNTAGSTLGREMDVELIISPSTRKYVLRRFSTRFELNIGKSTLRRVLVINYPSISSEQSLYRPFRANGPLHSGDWREIKIAGTSADHEGFASKTYEWAGIAYTLYYAVYGAAPHLDLTICNRKMDATCTNTQPNDRFSLEYEEDSIFLQRNFLLFAEPQEEIRAPSVFLYDLTNMVPLDLNPAPIGVIDGNSDVAISTTSRLIALSEDRSADSSDHAAHGDAPQQDRRHKEVSVYMQQGSSDLYDRQWTVVQDARPSSALEFGDDELLYLASGTSLSALRVSDHDELWTANLNLKAPIYRIKANPQISCLAVYNSHELILIDSTNGIPLSQTFEARKIEGVWWQDDGGLIVKTDNGLLKRESPYPPVR